MVDVSAKPATHRLAVARGRIRMQPATLQLILKGSAKKGDVLGVARVAAIQGAKRTSETIPLAHPLSLSRVSVKFAPNQEESSISIEVTTETTGPTGVEMEALCAVAAGLLTVYDMCKAVDRGMMISEVSLMEKRGGKSGHYVRPADIVVTKKKPRARRGF